MNAADRVEQGVLLLDDRCPCWRDKIDRDNLDVADPFNCVLSMVYGDWNKGLEALGIPFPRGTEPDLVYEHGFAGELTKDWLRYLEEETTPAGRVKHGAALLDRKVPGWASRVDLSVFKINSNSACILGQVFGYVPGNWPTIRDTLGLSGPDLKVSDEQCCKHGWIGQEHREHWSLAIASRLQEARHECV